MRTVSSYFWGARESRPVHKDEGGAQGRGWKEPAASGGGNPEAVEAGNPNPSHRRLNGRELVASPFVPSVPPSGQTLGHDQQPSVARVPHKGLHYTHECTHGFVNLHPSQLYMLISVKG